MSKIKSIYDKINKGEGLTNEEAKYMAFAIRSFKDEMDAVEKSSDRFDPKASQYITFVKFIRDERKLVDTNMSSIATYDKRLAEYRANLIGDRNMVLGKDGYYRIKK